MQGQARPTDNCIADYDAFFVNRREYTLQLVSPKAGFLPGVEAPPKPSSQKLGATTLQPGNRLRRASEFSILAEITGRTRKIGRNYFTRCPSCARHGRDRHGDNLAVSVIDPRKYRCWAGCTKEQIRDALGRPIINSRYAHGS